MATLHRIGWTESHTGWPQGWPSLGDDSILIWTLTWLGLGALLFWGITALARRFVRRLRSKLHAWRWQRAEQSAIRLLSRAGYQVIAQQQTHAWCIWIDDDPITVSMRVDAVVERDGHRYVAEIKSGHVASSAAHPATRRQLLEYACAYQTNGVLLVDAERNVIRTIVFDLPWLQDVHTGENN